MTMTNLIILVSEKMKVFMKNEHSHNGRYQLCLYFVFSHNTLLSITKICSFKVIFRHSPSGNINSSPKWLVWSNKYWRQLPITKNPACKFPASLIYSFRKDRAAQYMNHLLHSRCKHTEEMVRGAPAMR